MHFLMASTLFAAAAVSDLPPPAAVLVTAGQTYMILDPKMRLADYQQAYELLKKEKTTAKVYFTLSDGSTISNVVEMVPMGNGTLALFRFNSTQGIQFQVVKVEEIVSLSYY